MKYISDANGYIKEVSFGANVSCGGENCTEYIGSVPSGYGDIYEWYLDNVNCLYKWYISDDNLIKNNSIPNIIDELPTYLSKAKLLWEGSFSAGSITVPELSDYEYIAIDVSGYDLWCFGSAVWGIGGYGVYGSIYPCITYYRYLVSGNVLTIDAANRGMFEWNPSTGAVNAHTATRIVGLVKRADIEGWT